MGIKCIKKGLKQILDENGYVIAYSVNNVRYGTGYKDARIFSRLKIEESIISEKYLDKNRDSDPESDLLLCLNKNDIFDEHWKTNLDEACDMAIRQAVFDCESQIKNFEKLLIDASIFDKIFHPIILKNLKQRIHNIHNEKIEYKNFSDNNVVEKKLKFQPFFNNEHYQFMSIDLESFNIGHSFYIINYDNHNDDDFLKIVEYVVTEIDCSPDFDTLSVEKDLYTVIKSYLYFKIKEKNGKKEKSFNVCIDSQYLNKELTLNDILDNNFKYYDMPFDFPDLELSSPNERKNLIFLDKDIAEKNRDILASNLIKRISQLTI